MDITVHIASRGRPLQLVAALTSLQENESGDHNVRYGIACDVDDLATIGVCQTLVPKWRAGSGFRVGPRPVSVDSLHNQIALDIPGDVYVCFADDMLCTTKGWDSEIAKLVEENPKGLWWWSSTGDHFTRIPITSEAWRSAQGGIFPEYFPYWWGDTWVSEVWVLATEGSLKFAPIMFIDAPSKTINMRDLRFWNDFYHWLQPVRIEQAKHIAATLGLPLTITGVLSKFTSIPEAGFEDKIEEIEAGQGDKTEPHEGYKIAKARAEAMMGADARPSTPEISFDEILTPEVIAVLQRHFEGMPPL